MSFIPRIIKVDPMARLIDQMGKLQGEIRIREERLTKLKAELGEHMKAAGVAQYSGEMFAANWISKQVPRTNWKALVAALDISRDQVAEYTTVKTVSYPMVSARKR